MNGDQIVIITPSQEPFIALVVARVPALHPMAEAHARLIAAAPDLLAALKLYVEHFGDPLQVARAAIQKAEGR